MDEELPVDVKAEATRIAALVAAKIDDGSLAGVDERSLASAVRTLRAMADLTQFRPAEREVFSRTAEIVVNKIARRAAREIERALVELKAKPIWEKTDAARESLRTDEEGQQKLLETRDAPTDSPSGGAPAAAPETQPKKRKRKK